MSKTASGALRNLSVIFAGLAKEYDMAAAPIVEGFLSNEAMALHYGVLYKGYCEKWQKSVKQETANKIENYRDFKKNETFVANGKLLHERYFQNIGKAGDQDPGTISSELKKALTERFGSFNNWKKNYTETALASKSGWVVLSYCWNDKKLHNILVDSHDQGGLWESSCVLVLDMFEHAYLTDFKTDKEAYVEAFWNNINWTAVNRRWDLIQRWESLNEEDL